MGLHCVYRNWCILEEDWIIRVSLSCMLFIMDGVTVVFFLVFTSHASIYGMTKCCRPCQPSKEVVKSFS